MAQYFSRFTSETLGLRLVNGTFDEIVHVHVVKENLRGLGMRLNTFGRMVADRGREKKRAGSDAKNNTFPSIVFNLGLDPQL